VLPLASTARMVTVNGTPATWGDAIVENAKLFAALGTT